MIPAAFEYVRPRSADEAFAQMQKHGADARVLAGGQSLIPAMRFRLARPAVLVDINNARELDFIKLDGGLTLGALARDGDRLRPGAEGGTLAFLAELMRPYLEAYRLAAATALGLLSEGRPGAPEDRRALVRQALEQGRAAFLAGGVALREAVSKATLENAVEWMIAQGLLAEHDGRLTLHGRDALRGIVDGMGPLLSD